MFSTRFDECRRRRIRLPLQRKLPHDWRSHRADENFKLVHKPSPSNPCAATWAWPYSDSGSGKLRLPITEQVSVFAMNHALSMSRQRSEVPDNIDADDEAGERARTTLGKRAYDLNVLADAPPAWPIIRAPN